MKLTEEQAYTLSSCAEEAYMTPRAYSGRGMFGASCFGVITEDIGGLVEFGMRLAETDTELADMMRGLSARSDSMGRSGMVVYWTSLEWEGTGEDDEEEY